jgi:hypothetical protein
LSELLRKLRMRDRNGLVAKLKGERHCSYSSVIVSNMVKKEGNIGRFVVSFDCFDSISIFRYLLLFSKLFLLS